MCYRSLIPLCKLHNSHFSRNSSQDPGQKPILSKVFYVLWQGGFLGDHNLRTWSEGGGEERNWILSWGWITGSRKPPPTETAEKRKELASNAEAQTHMGISENTRSRQSSRDNPARESPLGPPQPVTVWLPPDPGFLREFNRPESSQLIPHMCTRWRGWLSAVTSVKT